MAGEGQRDGGLQDPAQATTGTLLTLPAHAAVCCSTRGQTPSLSAHSSNNLLLCTFSKE